MGEVVALRVTDLSFGYDDGASFLGPLDFEIGKGGLTAIVGPNGAGKSTLLRLLVGFLSPRRGAVLLGGKSLSDLDLQTRARRIAFLPQDARLPDDLTVRRIALLGRYPHKRYSLFDSDDDLRVADDALRATDTIQFAERTLSTISTGERQRVLLAGAMAQAPELYVLDEPTSALDPYYQLSIFRILRGLCDKGDAVVLATHDLNLAGRFADRILLLRSGKAVAYGPPASVLTTEQLRTAFDVSFDVLEGGADDCPRVYPAELVEGVRS